MGGWGEWGGGIIKTVLMAMEMVTVLVVMGVMVAVMERVIVVMGVIAAMVMELVMGGGPGGGGLKRLKRQGLGRAGLTRSRKILDALTKKTKAGKAI